MLKKTSLTLKSWQIDHYKRMAKEYGIDVSEMIRMALCIDILNATRIMFPEYHRSLDMKMIELTIRDHSIVKRKGRDHFKKILTKVYAETKKATRYWT